MQFSLVKVLSGVHGNLFKWNDKSLKVCNFKVQTLVANTGELVKPLLNRFYQDTKRKRNKTFLCKGRFHIYFYKSKLV